ncbi:MAG: hypothetical protein JGK01_10210 [Microcoleus sp. PH2017_03_ELD_O_A]|uniref:hypothetical protein n=1 Tax=unclassified Microcoleus TaxID=2642155 RepID=UPI001E1810F6|nr:MULTISPECIES: hypothetical protein [unclassified Microcoleus]MCC3431581.1 hypothetical protein [Microcoleus sp. PH2017_04_SCI_O_A]MCC3442160.1 hypothetical protein [Microcoleus sp. PH2017_03_ELD_O_A]MCC3550300.1 hypothetical protein [Microcoleus sp. PH2017_24_DOB_U_A]MCC3565386.1 hypothetical protein [Microcoleus sp. PH2017_31_RDM_U_A]
MNKLKAKKIANIFADQPSTVNRQLSTVNCQLSTVNYQLSTAIKTYFLSVIVKIAIRRCTFCISLLQNVTFVTNCSKKS